MSVPESPRDLGLSSDYWREGQQEAVAWLDQRPHHILAQILEAPTGWGKTYIKLAAALLELNRSGGVAYSLTSTTNLQEQEHDAWDEINILRGKQKVNCIEPSQIAFSYKVDDARCQGGFLCPVKYSHCEYYVARDLARTAQARITALTYAYYLTERRHVGKLPSPTVLVCDEAHNIERELMESVLIEVSNRRCRELGITIPPRNLLKAADWARQNLPSVYRIVDRLNELKKQTELDDGDRQRLKQWTTIQGSMEGILDAAADPDNWVMEKTDPVLQFKPIFIHDYARKLLWSGAGRIILTSATLPQHEYFARIVGLPDWDAKVLPAVFPKERRPVYWAPLPVEFNHRTEGPDTPAWDWMVKRVDEIMAGYPNQKGFIHTMSYARAHYIKERSRFASRIIQPRNAVELKERVLPTWKSHRKPMMIASPSIWEGINEGTDEHNAVQIIVKLNYPYMPSPQVAARLKADPTYGPFYTGLHLVQATGRGMRHPQDRCDTFVLDPTLGHWLDRHGEHVPAWWRESVQQVA